MFPLIIFVGAVPPSVRFIPVMVVVPETVIFAKLLFNTLETQPRTEKPASVIKIKLPDAPVLAKVPLIELLLQFFTLVAVAYKYS
ncbi:MAG: hypothetical protein IPP32_02215 [Bacteroidetes bacterium]|nr:hypothetical protein [Bacteroidota bacterium]